DIHINNVKNKRNYENENPETLEVPIKKVNISVGNDGSLSENNEYEKHHEEDEKIISSEVKSIKYQIGFEEVVGNACEHEDKKWSEIEKKFLSALREYGADKNDFNKTETLEILVY
ncbi:28681_t:CDS:2, partial [Racocetra persica]